MRLEGQADSAAPPEKVWRALTDEARLASWFSGAKDAAVSDGWPAVGGKIAFRVGPSRFEGRVVESSAPRVLVLDVTTPSARSRVTSRIEAVGAGSRYHRTVEPEWKSALGPIFGKLVIGPSVKREARRLAKVAEQ